MASIVERLMVKCVYRLDPEQGLIPMVSAFGIRLKQRLDNFHFDLRLLDLQYPNLLHLFQTCHAYARHQTFEYCEIEAKAWARTHYENCYFLHLADAEGYYFTIFFPRYFIRSISITFREVAKYFWQLLHGDKAPLTSIQLCLAAYFTTPVIEEAR